MNSGSRLANVLAGGFWGAFIAILVKGLLLGLSQTDAGWGWLSVPVGILFAPTLLVPDLLILFGNGPLDRIAVLHWALTGLLLGAAAGSRMRTSGQGS